MQITRDSSFQTESEQSLSSQNSLFRQFFLFSLGLHILLVIYLIAKSILFPDQPTEYFPSLRVDLVGLPDLKKADTVTPKPAEPDPTSAPPAFQKPVPKPDIKPDIKADAKATAEADDFAVQKKKADHKKKEKEAQKKLKAALERIKAIERIKAMTSGEMVRGNQVSKGSALSGEAKTSLETTYFDVVLERVQSNWELPKWLQDQNLSAKVMIYLDARGGLKSFQFVKPSGNEQFDSEVKRTLQASSPFPLPPSEIASDLSGKGILLGFPL